MDAGDAADVDVGEGVDVLEVASCGDVEATTGM